MSGENIIEAHGLTCRYGDLVAVDGADFAVPFGYTLSSLAAIAI